MTFKISFHTSDKALVHAVVGIIHRSWRCVLWRSIWVANLRRHFPHHGSPKSQIDVYSLRVRLMRGLRFSQYCCREFRYSAACSRVAELVFPEVWRNAVLSKLIPLRLTSKMQRYTILFIAVNVLHVSGGFSAHYQELEMYTQHLVCVHFELLMMDGKPAWNM